MVEGSGFAKSLNSCVCVCVCVCVWMLWFNNPNRILSFVSTHRFACLLRQKRKAHERLRFELLLACVRQALTRSSLKGGSS